MPDIKLAACSGANPRAAAGEQGGWVSLYQLDLALGKTQTLARSQTVPSPSFLAWLSASSRLYVASELATGDGRVTDLRLNDCEFAVGNSVATGGNAAVHLCLDRQGKSLFVANYQADDTSNPVSVAVFALKRDGSIGAMTGSAIHAGGGPDKSRQSRPHCHAVMISPDNRLLAAADLGADSLYFYRFDAADGTISLVNQLKLPPGTGPRHCAFHPSKPFLYLTGELNSSVMTISIDSVTADAHLVESVASTALEPEERNYPSGIVISPDGDYVLVANRGADTIAVFRVDPQTGIARLRSEIPCGGRFPRAIRFDPSARYLAVANQHSGDISMFNWDFSEGVLSDKPFLRIDIPIPLDMIFID